MDVRTDDLLLTMSTCDYTFKGSRRWARAFWSSAESSFISCSVSHLELACWAACSCWRFSSASCSFFR